MDSSEELCKRTLSEIAQEIKQQMDTLPHEIKIEIGKSVSKDLVPCKLVTFDKEQIVIWRGNDYKPNEGGIFLTERESYDDRKDDGSDVNGEHDNIGDNDNKPHQCGIFLAERESFDDRADSASSLNLEQHENTDNGPSEFDLYSGNDSD